MCIFLPPKGCCYGNVRRSMVIDLESLHKDGVQDVFVFCNHSELKMCHADDLLYGYDRRGFKVHYYPIANDQTMSVSKCVPILCEIESCLRAGHKIILQCVDGLGKSCTVAGALWLFLDKHVTPLVVMETLCQLRGPMAIARVKHYNYLNDFRKNAALVLSPT
ncbi:cyclin-dependent kinase inhibitor 3-like [Dysidea avara]|uniref:cyclin-dependent kinase inhibitor 3-like n=1 Tax=Dysidea avara TaxID=196820 RepID=UPI00331D463A